MELELSHTHRIFPVEKMNWLVRFPSWADIYVWKQFENAFVVRKM